MEAPDDVHGPESSFRSKWVTSGSDCNAHERVAVAAQMWEGNGLAAGADVGGVGPVQVNRGFRGLPPGCGLPVRLSVLLTVGLGFHSWSLLRLSSWSLTL
jgi:hypothetical protein